MASKPYYTTTELIESVKRKIAIPINQNTFTEDDIIKFANEEMFISQVPSVMMYHEEYFVDTLTVPLESDRKKYPIPERAIGNKIRALFFVDTNNNEFEMTQINRDDRTSFNEGFNGGNIHKFYFEGDSVVLVSNSNNNITGSLKFDYYLRPNSLVKNEFAAICTSFSKTITVDNANVVSGDKVTIGSLELIADTDFSIGVSSIETATNLTVAINNSGLYTANNGTISTTVVTVTYKILSTVIESSSSGFTIDSLQGIIFSSVPENIEQASFIDFIQTRGSHKTYAYGKSFVSISGNTIKFNATEVPEDFVVGDYICEEFECIIPQIPDDLHTSLSERVCSRILSSMGDVNGYKMTADKINEIEARQGTLIDNRAEGNPQKINNTHSPLRYGKRRRFTRRL